MLAEAVSREAADARGQSHERAIGEIKRAFLDDGKGLKDSCPVDTRLSPHDRFRTANELLWSAHNDLTRAEDGPESRGLQDWAIGRVDGAHGIVDRVERAAQWQ